MCEVHKISHLIQNKSIEFIVKNDSKKSHFKQAAFWNIRELNMETNFKRAKHQAVESEMIEDYCYGGGKMPKWNR
jgi:hypothetical protein